MRIPVLIALAGLASATPGLAAEAGAPPLRGPEPVDATGAIPGPAASAPGLAARLEAGSDARPGYVVLPSPEARPEPAGAAPVAARATAPAAPWCRSQHVVGTGAGFCLIN